MSVGGTWGWTWLWVFHGRSRGIVVDDPPSRRHGRRRPIERLRDDFQPPPPVGPGVRDGASAPAEAPRLGDDAGDGNVVGLDGEGFVDLDVEGGGPDLDFGADSR
mgnify:CR=1 FL=1